MSAAIAQNPVSQIPVDPSCMAGTDVWMESQDTNLPPKTIFYNGRYFRCPARCVCGDRCRVSLRGKVVTWGWMAYWKSPDIHLLVFGTTEFLCRKKLREAWDLHCKQNPCSDPDLLKKAEANGDEGIILIRFGSDRMPQDYKTLTLGRRSA